MKWKWFAAVVLGLVLVPFLWAEGGKEPPATGRGPLKISVFTMENRNPDWPLSKAVPILQEVQKRANVELQFQPATDSQMKTTLQTRLAAGTDLPDMVYLVNFTNDELYTLAKQGLIIELTDLMPKYAPNFMKVIAENPDLKPSITAPDGKMYWFDTFSKVEPEIYTGLWLRRDFLKNVGITKLPDTTDEFYDDIKKMHDGDSNGDGKQNEIFLPYQWWQFEWGIPTAFGVKNVDWNVGDDGKVYLGRLTPEYKDFLTFANKLYANKLTDPDVVTITWDNFIAKYQEQNIVVGAVNAPRALLWNKQNSNHGNSDPVFLPPLQSPRGKRIAVRSNTGGFPWAITKNSKNVQGVLKFVNYLFSDEGRTMVNWGLEGVHYTKGADGKLTRSQAYKDGIAKDPVNYPASQGFGFQGAIPYATVLNTQQWADLNIEGFKQAGVNPQELIDVVNMYKKVAVPDFPSIILTADESTAYQGLGTDWKNYIDEMAQKFFMGVEPLSNFDDFVKKANDLGATKATAIWQGAYNRWKSVNK